MSIEARASRFDSSVAGTDRGGDARLSDGQMATLLLALRVCRERLRASCSCANLLWVGARVGSGGSSSMD